MQVSVQIGLLREAIIQCSHTLDTKQASIGSWLYLIARAAKGEKEAALYLYSSNLGMARTLLKLPAEVTKDGEVIIMPKLLQSILVSLPADEDIEFSMSASGAKLEVKYGSLKSQIAVHAESQKAAEVLKSIPFNAKSCTSVSAATLVDIINRTLFCTTSGAEAVSEGPWLSSVCLALGDGSVLGTATNRIIAGRAEVLDGIVLKSDTMAIHRDALFALKAILSKREKEEVTITNAQATTATSNSTNEILFRFSDVILGVRQLASDYPKAVEKIFTLPSNTSRATVNRKLLLSVLGRLSAFAEKNSFTVSFSSDKLGLLTKGFNSTFQEQIAKTEKTEGTITIGLGIRDVENILSVMKSEEVIIHYKADTDHVHFQEGDSNFKYVLSPVVVAWANKGKAV